MDKLSFYTVDEDYIKYLRKFDDKVTDPKLGNRQFERPFVGILLKIDDINYIAPLSSFKQKHNNMKEKLDFIKIGTYAVMNLNDMIPVKPENIKRVNFKDIPDQNYKSLLVNEYEIINSKKNKILKNASVLHRQVVEYKAPIAKRCCNFELLEKKALEYNKCFLSDEVKQIDKDSGNVHIYELKNNKDDRFFIGNASPKGVERLNEFSTKEATEKTYKEFKNYEEIQSRVKNKGIQID